MTENDDIRDAAIEVGKDSSREKYAGLSDVLVKAVLEKRETLAPVMSAVYIFKNGSIDQQEKKTYRFMMRDENGRGWYPLFTDREEIDRGTLSNATVPITVEEILQLALFDEACSGVVVNPFGPSIAVTHDMLENIFLRYCREAIWEDELKKPSGSLAKKVLGYLDKLCAMQVSGAFVIKGAMYYEGRGVAQDMAEAASLYEKGADLGDSLALSNLGYCCLYGNGMRVNKKKAYCCFSAAAIMGEHDAINMLGDMYRDGVYVPENKTIAYRIYRRGMDVIYPDHSSDAYPANRMRLGECFMKGYGCRQDQKLALTLLTEAKGVFEEQSRAGRIYAGSGLKRTEALLTELMEAMKDKES